MSAQQILIFSCLCPFNDFQYHQHLSKKHTPSALWTYRQKKSVEIKLSIWPLEHGTPRASPGLPSSPAAAGPVPQPANCERRRPKVRRLGWSPRLQDSRTHHSAFCRAKSSHSEKGTPSTTEKTGLVWTGSGWLARPEPLVRQRAGDQCVHGRERRRRGWEGAGNRLGESTSLSVCMINRI